MMLHDADLDHTYKYISLCKEAKMATASSRPVMITVRYNDKRVTVYVTPDDRADKIIEQAAEKLKESPADLQLLYQGTAVPPDAIVKDALRSQATVIHLVKATGTRTNSRHHTVCMDLAFILLKDSEGEGRARIPQVLRRPPTSKVLRGELLVPIPGDEIVPRNDGQKPHNYRVKKDPSISLYCSEQDLAPLGQYKILLLEAVSTPNARFSLFLSDNMLDWGQRVKTGDDVFVVVPPYHHTQLMPRAAAKVRCVGGLGTDDNVQKGVFFGVEIMDKQYRGQGTTDGTFKGTRYFTCEDDCGLFVSLDRLSPDREGSTLAHPPPGGQAGTDQVVHDKTRSSGRANSARSPASEPEAHRHPRSTGSREPVPVSHQELERLQKEITQLRRENEELQQKVSQHQQRLEETLVQKDLETHRLEENLRQKDLETRRLEESLHHQQQQFVQTERTLRAQVQQLQGQAAQADRYRDQVGELQAQVERMRLSPGRQLSSQEIEFWKISRQEVQIFGEIGSGAWGYVAKGIFRGREVAVKWPHMAILTAKVVDRLRREVRIMAKVRHPNLLLFIAAVFDEQADRLQEPPLIITELLTTDLRSAYKQGQLKDSSKLPIFRDVACALHYLHQHHEPIIHRDVSAPNVLLEALPRNQWKAKLSDFGSANLAKLARTAGEGAIIYSAPETFPVDIHDPNAVIPPQTTKIDVYSYGVLLCEVITNQMPASDDYRSMLQQVQRQWPFMYNLIISCTKRKPEDRPTMAAVLSELNKITPR